MNEFHVSALKHPFGVGGRWDAVAQEGSSIQDIVDSIPDEFFRFTPREKMCALVNSQPVPRSMWPYVRPKVAGKLPVHVAVVPMVHGGGDDGGGKSIVAAVASIAILALTAFAASPLVVGGVLGLSGTAASLASAGIVAAGSVIGALAKAALSPPPAAQARSSFDDETTGKDLGSAFADGNILAPGGAIPVCVGRRKVFPPFACQPLVEIVGDDEVVEALYCLNGPHDLDNIKVANVPINDLPDVRHQVREGWDSDGAVSLVSRYAATQNANIKLIGHTCAADSAELDTKSSPEDSLPQWQRFTVAKYADEIWLALAFSGFSDTQDPTTVMAVPIRIRIRLKGASVWQNLPEVHITAKTYSTVRKQVKIIWDETPPPVPTPPTANGPYVAFKETIGQDGSTVSPSTDAWVAHEIFDGGAGLTDVTRISLQQDRFDFYLSEAAFPRVGQYEVEIMRGYAHEKDRFTPATYLYNNGSNNYVRDFFKYESADGGSIAVSSNDTVSPLTVLRVSAVKNEHPVQRSGLALLAVRGTNVGVTDVSIEAARYVQDWDGTEWAAWSTTGNPAPHIRDVLTGNLTAPAKRVPASELDEAGLLAFRTYCETYTHNVAAIIDERSMAEVLTAIASSAYGKMKRSHNVGVVIDNDRSNDTFKQVFTPRDSRNFSWAKTFIEPVDGFRVSYVDANDDWQTVEMPVYADGKSKDTASLLEAVSYDTITDRHKVIARARFDLKHTLLRSNLYTLEAPAMYLTCQRGDLVGVSNDMLIKQSGWARIKSITRNGSDEITAITLDSTIDMPDSVPFWDVTDFWGISDIWAQGAKAYAYVQAFDGTINALGAVTGTGDDPTYSNALEPDTAVVNNSIEVGNLLVAGPSTEVFKRMIVLDIRPGKDLTATLTLVDEAPELHIPADQYASASGSISVTGTAAAEIDAVSISGTISITGTASGYVPNASASGTISIVGTATGDVSGGDQNASASGTISINGTAGGSVASYASASGTLSVTGTASASVGALGSASGTISITGTASAIVALTTSASGTLSVTGTATGSLAKPISASGTLSINGTAAALKQASFWDVEDIWAESDFWAIGTPS